MNWILDLRELRFVAEILEELQMWRGAFVASVKKLGEIRGIGRHLKSGTSAPEMLNDWLTQLRICACEWVRMLSPSAYVNTDLSCLRPVQKVSVS